MADPTVQQILEETIPGSLEAQPGLAGEIDALVHFRITGAGGGDWTLDCRGGAEKVSRGAEGDPAVTITCSDADFISIATKKLDANMAAMSGKLKFAPMDMALALKLAKLL